MNQNNLAMMNESITTIMTPQPHTVQVNSLVSDTAKLMLEQSIHVVPVMNGNLLVGMICGYDFAKFMDSTHDYNTMKVEQVMSNKFVKLSKDDKIGTAAELLLDRRFKALAVVDHEDELVGIVTSYDVLRYEFKKEYHNPILYREVLNGNLRKVI